jgi:hypothetical protein
MKFIVILEDGKEILADSLDIKNDVIYINGKEGIPQCRVEAIKIG